MHFFSDTVLWKGVDMEPGDIIFKPDGVWKEVGILDYFVPSFLGSESINCKISGFAKKVSREIKGLFGGY